MTSWDEPKRRRNIKVHGLDFEGSEAIWDNFTVTREDMHVISFRRAEKYEARYYLETAEEYFRKNR